MLSDAEKARITALYLQIDAIFQEAKARPSNKECHICGAGDLTSKNGIMFKVKGVVSRYEHRPAASPHLCHRHNSGWSLSVDSFDPLRKRSDEEVDLHFGAFIAKQLIKESRKHV